MPRAKTKTKSKPKSKSKPKRKASAKRSKRSVKDSDPAAVAERFGRVRRPSWQGSISFGLIHIPVQLYGVSVNTRVSFHQLHRDDGARVRQQRVCELEDAPVDYDDVVKGYEIEPGRYVIIENEELDQLSPMRSTALELEKFVELDTIDPLLFEDGYYVVPGKGAESPYALLRDAMSAEGRAGVARLVMHRREHLAALWAHDEALVLSTLRFAEQLADLSDLPVEVPSKRAGAPAKQELKAARQLISALTGEFEIDDYEDEYRKELLKLIAAKEAGEAPVKAPSPAPAREPVTDLMSALEESLEEVGSGRPVRRGARRRGSKGTHRSRAAKGS